MKQRSKARFNGNDSRRVWRNMKPQPDADPIRVILCQSVAKKLFVKSFSKLRALRFSVVQPYSWRLTKNPGADAAGFARTGWFVGVE
jgi:hypothetical protein